MPPTKLRESKIGFQTGCGLDEDQYNDNFKDYWHLDPVKPEIAWIIDTREKKEMDLFAPGLRPIGERRAPQLCLRGDDVQTADP